ncbi:plasmid replication protein RepC [Roseibium litorale]|uniref:Replication protein C n=1 Tax=Roseibium litorale TaxID=2803841 RepID=A0ABR9CTP5_9HYPH|nr:plasmid replication protein RepC [Roseibium litorale]MBD8894256.1 replication protein C [Roseibium litorale]
MTERIATTPFGGGPYSIALFKAQQRMDRLRDSARESAEQGGNLTAKADKWQLLRALTEARADFGLSDRAIAVLEALTSFYPGKELDGTKDMIVFPSNAELSIRTRGMAPATLRRHIAALIQAGLLLRRDSPNGKRFVRRDASGAMDEAFGFNLAPLALSAPEIFEKAEAARARSAAIRKVRGEITLHLRDIAKMIAAAHEDGQALRLPALWQDFTLGLQALSGRVLRHAPLEDLNLRRDGLLRLRAEVESAFLAGMSDEDLSAADCAYEEEEARKYNELNQNMSGNGHHNELHIQNSKTELSYEYLKENNEPADASDLSASALAEAGLTETREAEAGGHANRTKPDKSDNPRSEAVPLADLKRACPQFADYALNGLVTWADARAAADLARPMLGISADAWGRAQKAMGLAGAIVTIAYLIERAGEIKSPGGYIRTLTLKADAGKFRLRPMLDSLMNRE